MKKPRVTILQHSSVVRPYALFDLFKKLDAEIELCTFVPGLQALGWKEPPESAPIVLLGGPQSVYEREAHPWLEKEISYIKKCIDGKFPVFGICLGSQILSEILGGRVSKSLEPEVGWYPIKISEHAKVIGLEDQTLNFFQWHFDTFTLPQEATPLFLGSSPNECQGFLWRDQILAVQFHPEMTHDGALLLCNKYQVPMGTQFDTSACRKTDFETHAQSAHSSLEKMLCWFLSKI